MVNKMNKLTKEDIIKAQRKLAAAIRELPMEECIEALNLARAELSVACPNAGHPVDHIIWVPSDKVVANDYNPNKVAPPEMRLLELSIREDGYTQPIVVIYDAELDVYIVVDGFHRNRVGKECEAVRQSIHGYLPVVVIDKDISGRMASTIRHNRARGTHQVQGMAEIVAELHLKGMSDKKIGEQLGMEKDEVLRLKQFMGLGDLFKNRDFSKAWV